MITAFPRDIRATVGFLLAVVASLSGLPVASAQCGAGWVPGFESGDQGINAEGFVGNAVEALPGGGFVVGGFFVEAGGVPAESIAQWTGQAWKPLGAGLRPDKTSQYAEVIDLAVLPNGDIVAAGLFAFAGDVAARNIARWNGSSWFPLGSGIEGTPRALAVLPNGHLVVAGQILSAGGVPVNNIARWDGASWHALGAGLDYPGGFAAVESLQVMADGSLVAGGQFTKAGTVAASSVASWNGSAWSPLGAGVTLGGVAGTVSALALLPNGDLAACGGFSVAGVVSAHNVARWNGTAWAAFGSGLQDWGGVNALAVLPSGELVAGGSFFPGTTGVATHVARWTGAQWEALSWEAEAPHDEVNDLALLPNGALVAVGGFTSNGPIGADGVVLWDGAHWNAVGSGLWNGGAGGGAPTQPTISAFLALPNGELIVGGQFNTAGGVRVNNIARWNGAAWSPLGAGLTAADGEYPAMVHALALMPNGDIIAAGRFKRTGQNAAQNIARWNGSSWSSLGAGIGGTGHALAVLPDGSIVAGGSFQTAGNGIVAFNIARWTGSAWVQMGAGVSAASFVSAVYALAVLPNGALAVGGEFELAGGVAAKSVALWQQSGWSTLGTGIQGPCPNVRALAVLPNGNLVAGGGGFSAGILRWNGTNWSGLGTGVAGGVGCQGQVSALAVLPSGELVAGGLFTSAGGSPAMKIARWSGSAWSAFGQGLGTAGEVLALARLGSGDLMAGGSFDWAENRSVNKIARWSWTGTPWIASQPSGRSIDAGDTLELAASCASGFDSSQPVAFRWKRNGADVSNGAGGASAGGGTVSGAVGTLAAGEVTVRLAIANARTSDAGSYTVVFSNSCGSVASTAATVTVAAACAADLNGDGMVGAADLSQLLVQWGASGGDIDGDGSTDAEDLSAILLAWGPCAP